MICYKLLTIHNTYYNVLYVFLAHIYIYTYIYMYI